MTRTIQQCEFTVDKIEKDYQIVRVLGKGSYGEVVLVRHKNSGQEYALKFYSVAHLCKNNKMHALKRSRKILRSLHSDKIIKLLGIAEDQEKILLLYEVCKNGNFQQFLNIHRNKLDEDIKKFYIIQMAEILKILKQNQIAHRDIKPSNFVLDKEGRLKLIDFDEAISFSEGLFTKKQDEQIIHQKYKNRPRKNTEQIKKLLYLEHLRSRQPTMVGTQCYLAPELADDNQYTESGDIWSLGCIIYEILTNKKFMLEEQEELDIKDNIKFATNYPEAYDLLEKVLRKKPVERLTIYGVLDHKYLKSFLENQQLKNKTLQRLTKLVKKIPRLMSPAEIQQTIENSPYLSNFSKAQPIRLNLLVLFKGWYFYTPKYLIAGRNSFKIASTSQQTEYLIEYGDIKKIQLVGHVIHISARQQFYIKHIKAEYSARLLSLMREILDL